MGFHFIIMGVYLNNWCFSAYCLTISLLFHAYKYISRSAWMCYSSTLIPLKLLFEIYYDYLEKGRLSLSGASCWQVTYTVGRQPIRLHPNLDSVVDWALDVYVQVESPSHRLISTCKTLSIGMRLFCFFRLLFYSFMMWWNILILHSALQQLTPEETNMERMPLRYTTISHAVSMQYKWQSIKSSMLVFSVMPRHHCNSLWERLE